MFFFPLRLRWAVSFLAVLWNCGKPYQFIIPVNTPVCYCGATAILQECFLCGGGSRGFSEKNVLKCCFSRYLSEKHQEIWV